MSVFSFSQTLDKGFWDAVKGKSMSEINARIRDKCKNFAHFEEYNSLMNFGELIFRSVIRTMDSDWENNKSFFSLNK